MMYRMLRYKLKYKISSITNWATTSALAAVENKIPSVSNLVKKKQKKTLELCSKDYNSKINEIQKKITDYNNDKYITIPKFNKFTKKIFDLRLKRLNLARKTDVVNFVNTTDFDNKPS